MFIVPLARYDSSRRCSPVRGPWWSLSRATERSYKADRWSVGGPKGVIAFSEARDAHAKPARKQVASPSKPQVETQIMASRPSIRCNARLGVSPGGAA
jgi:hypothetical protein